MALSHGQGENNSWERVIDSVRPGCVPVFRDTDVPVQSLFNHLHAGDSVGTFLDEFPAVTRSQVESVIHLAAHYLLREIVR